MLSYSHPVNSSMFSRSTWVFLQGPNGGGSLGEAQEGSRQHRQRLRHAHDDGFLFSPFPRLHAGSSPARLRTALRYTRSKFPLLRARVGDSVARCFRCTVRKECLICQARGERGGRSVGNFSSPSPSFSSSFEVPTSFALNEEQCTLWGQRRGWRAVTSEVVVGIFSLIAHQSSRYQRLNKGLSAPLFQGK